MLAENAVVLDAFDAGGFGLSDGFVVVDLVLEPEVGDMEADHVLDNGRDVLGGAEDIDQVDLASFDGYGGLRILKRPVAGQDFAVHGNFAQTRIDGDDAVALRGEIAADVVAGAVSLVAHAQHGDGPGVGQHFDDQLVGVSGIRHSYLLKLENQLDLLREWMRIVRIGQLRCWSVTRV